MARTLASGANLSHAAAVLTGYPISFACWFKRGASVPATESLIEVNDGSTNNRFGLVLSSASANKLTTFSTAAGSAASAVTTASYTADAWQHGAGVHASATSRAVYLNGANKVTNSTSRTPTGLNRSTIGCVVNSTSFPFLGDIAECAIWSVALSDAEVALLAAGLRPCYVQRASLVAYWPVRGLVSPEPDVIGAFSMTVAGTPAEVTPNPGVIYPTRALVGRRLAA